MHLPAQQRIRSDIKDRLKRLDRAPDPDAALGIFLDLNLEYEPLRDFKSLCVLIPDECLSTPASLYLRNRKGDLILRRTTLPHEPAPPWPDRPPPGPVFRYEDSGIFPLRDGSKPDISGLLCLHRPLSGREEEFFSGYARRAGRILALRRTELENRQRLTFINTLMRDIGHNIIVPNMQFKLLFSRMEERLRDMEDKVNALAPAKSNAPDLSIRRALPLLLRDLRNQLDTIARRFHQSSLFLESLLRREHFEKGNYHLRLRPCHVGHQLLEPQLERFRPLLRDQGIEIVDSRPAGEALVEADPGLISQVLANLLANAAKYTQATRTAEGLPGKILRCGWDFSDSALGEDRPGVRIFVSTSGLPVPPEDIPHLFDARFRSAATRPAEGSGHGLFFVRQIVELHRGRIDYSHAERMNTFSITLPSPLATEEGGLTCSRQS